MKHLFLEWTLEILQQFHVKMDTKPKEFCLFLGDLSLITIKCVEYGKRATAPGSIGGALFHASTAMLRHWNMIYPNEDTNDNEMMSVLLLFTSFESCL